MREMTSPGVWTDMGPQPAIRRVHGYTTLGGSIVTARKAPSLGIQTNGELIRHRRQMARRKVAFEPCGFIMVIIGEPCARRKGHAQFTGGSHRSAEAMRDDAARRSAR
jgi:hypothetical protein